MASKGFCELGIAKVSKAFLTHVIAITGPYGVDKSQIDFHHIDGKIFTVDGCGPIVTQDLSTLYSAWVGSGNV